MGDFGLVGGPLVRAVLLGDRDRASVLANAEERHLGDPSVIARRMGRLLGAGHLKESLSVGPGVSVDGDNGLPKRVACLFIHLSLNELRAAPETTSDQLELIVSQCRRYIELQWPAQQIPGIGIAGLRSVRGVFEGVLLEVNFRDMSDLTRFIDRCLKFIPNVRSVGANVVEEDYFAR